MTIKIIKKHNVLNELFGSLKFKKSTEQILKEAREKFENLPNVDFKKK